MPRIVPRSGWGAAAPESITPSEPSTLRGVVVHWFGSPRAAAQHGDCANLLRSVQRAHMAGEFSDIAYNHAVCPHGAVYELRGFHRQTGANGNSQANRQYAAVVYMAGVGDKPTEVGLQSLRWIIRQWHERGAGPEVLPHGQITGSACPGPELALWIKRGAYKYPATPPETAEQNRRRLASIRRWITARRRAGWSWARIKRAANWREYLRRGGR